MSGSTGNWEDSDWREVGILQNERDVSPLTCEMTGAAASHSNALRLSLLPSGSSWNKMITASVWTSHHALFDGRSRVILLHELFALYDASLREPASVPRAASSL